MKEKEYWFQSLKKCYKSYRDTGIDGYFGKGKTYSRRGKKWSHKNKNKSKTSFPVGVGLFYLHKAKIRVIDFEEKS